MYVQNVLKVIQMLSKLKKMKNIPIKTQYTFIYSTRHEDELFYNEHYILLKTMQSPLKSYFYL